jgi:Domain of unknown function (DUF5916)/Carbohydrate family 9 binding domain-like
MTRLIAVLALALPLAAQPVAQKYEVRAATSKIEVNGVLDEQAWQDATLIPVEYEWLPGDNAKPPVRTDALVTFDADNVYIGFRAFDPKPSEIRAHLMDRDTIVTFVQDDHVTFMLDPFNDERRAFQFRVNPLGVQADAIFSQVEFVEDFSWDIIWSSAGRITAEGYVVEVAVPVNQLRFPRTDGPQTWGIELGRSYPRSVRHRISANPRSRNNNCILCQINKVTGFRGLEPGKNLEVAPTLTTTRTDEAGLAFPAGNLEGGDTKIEPGVSARWGISPAITMNATINPDFSQIEADAAQLSENERFALFFPEKRPFFLEGVDFFATPINAVFTRTVVDPAWGLKLTGKEGKNAGGVFVTQDEANALIIPSNQGSRPAFLEDRVTAAVARYRRDIGASSTFGALYAGRQGDGYHNHVAGLDGFLRLSDADEIRVQYLRSDTQYPGAVAVPNRQSLDSFSGDALTFTYDHGTRNWIWNLAYDDFDPSFRADSGFVPRVDVRTMFGALTRRFWGDGNDWYTLWQVGGRASRTKDHSGRLTDEEGVLTSTVQGPLQSLLQVNVRNRSTFFVNRLYEDLLRADAFFEIQPSAIGKFSLFVQAGETVDFANNQPADVLQINPAAELKIGRHINAQLSHIAQRLDSDRGRVSDTNITEMRLVYNINIRSFVRGIVQHVDIERDPALFSTPEVKTLFTQLLFSYKVNPQTVLFLGYSDNQLGLQQFDLTRTDRTFFAKIGYAWIF